MSDWYLGVFMEADKIVIIYQLTFDKFIFLAKVMFLLTYSNQLFCYVESVECKYKKLDCIKGEKMYYNLTGFLTKLRPRIQLFRQQLS